MTCKGEAKFDQDDKLLINKLTVCANIETGNKIDIKELSLDENVTTIDSTPNDSIQE